MKTIFIIKSPTNHLLVWKTHNIEQDEIDRWRDIKNNYPIRIPLVNIGEQQINILTDVGYYPDGKNMKGNLLAIIIVNGYGVEQILKP